MFRGFVFFLKFRTRLYCKFLWDFEYFNVICIFLQKLFNCCNHSHQQKEKGKLRTTKGKWKNRTPNEGWKGEQNQGGYSKLQSSRLKHDANAEEKFLPIIPLQKREIKTEYKLVDGQGVSYKVCKKFFLGLYRVSLSRVYRAIKSSISNPCASERPERSTSPNKTSARARNGVQWFINKISKCESH